MWAPNWYESAHEQLKLKYGKYMFFSALLALVITGMGAAFAPPYVPSPYQLRERKVEAVNLATDDIFVPPPPKKLEMVALDGTPAQNLVKVYDFGLRVVKTNKDDPAKAAAALQEVLKNYNVAGLRAKASDAKKAGKGASKKEIASLKALKAEYDKLGTELGGKDKAYNEAHKEWVKAWGK